MPDVSEEIARRKAQAGELILQALTQNGLNALMMAAYQIWTAPVLLADINSRVIFQYPLQEIGDTAFDTILKNKCLDANLADTYTREWEHDKYDMWKPFYANKGLTASYPRLYGIVSYYGIKQATLAIFLGEKPMRDGDLEIVEMFTKALEVKFKKDISGNLDWVPPTAVCLQDVLDPNATPYLKRAAAQSIRENLIGAFVVMVTPVGDTVRQKTVAAYATSEVMRRFRNLISVQFNNDLVTLFGEVSEASFDPGHARFIQDLTGYLHQFGLTSGLSLPFADPEWIPGYYEQAKLTAQLAPELGTVAFLNSGDVFSRLLFREVANSPIPEVFVHRLLPRLRQFDADNNTVYYQTLRAYCAAFFDRDAAAAAIAVHRNTMVYRLHRLSEVFSVDLEDATLRRELYCSFLMENEIQ